MDINLHIKDKIGQDKQATKKILGTIKASNRTLLVAPMSAGKTYLIINDIKDMAFKEGKKVVIVIPGVKQILSTETEYGITSVCDGKGYGGQGIVAVTPDSLPKVMSKLKKDSFYLVVDEAHEKYSSVAFRSAFKNIPIAEMQAYKTIYTTATPQNLDVDTFDSIITIDRADKLSTTATILQVEHMNIDTFKMVIGEYRGMGSQVVCFNNNINENNIIADYFHDERINTRQVLTEDYQLELEQDNAKYKQVEEISLLYKTSTIKASDRGTEIDNAIRKGKLPKDIDLLMSTSAIKAGINIENDKNTIAIVVCKRNDFNLLDQIQSIGRFRAGLRHVIFIVPKTKSKAGLRYDALETVREARGAVIKDTLALLNNNLTGAKYVDEIVSACHAVKTKKGNYETDELMANAEAFNAWAKSLLKFPNILKKELLSNKAIHFKDIQVKDFNAEAGEELKNVMKEHKEMQAQELKEAVEFIKGLDNDTKAEVLDYTLDQRKASIETVEAMKLWHKLGKKKKLEEVAKMLHQGDRLTAFDDMASRDISTINKNIRSERTKLINRDINKLGAEAYLKDVAKGTIQVRTAKIRYELKDLESKRGRLTKKRLDRLARTLINEKYINNKTLNNPQSSKKDKEKALKLATKGLSREIKLIYNFKDTDTISSAKTK